MRRKLIYSLVLLFLLFSAGSGLTMIYIYRVTTNLQSVINLHRIEIIRQNLVINMQTVQSNLYTTGTTFGKELDVIVDNVTALDDSVRGCSGCHHSKEMTARLQEVEKITEHYKEAISYLITTTANKERIERLKMVAVGIGDTLLSKTQEMAFLADKSLTARTEGAIREINNSKSILIVTVILALFIALIIAIALTKQITEPVYALVDATRMISSGHLGYVTSYDDRTEFGELARNFNSMSVRLKEEREDIVHYIEQLSGLYNITLSIYGITDMENAYPKICRDLSELLKVERCSVMLYHAGDDMFLTHPSAYGLSSEDVEMLRFPGEQGRELFRKSHGLPIISNNPGDDGRLVPFIRPGMHDRSLLVAWFQGKEKLLGALRVSNKSGEFTDDDAKLLTILANHLAVAIENAELYRSLQEQMLELRETQDQLIQSAKLAAIGELASNVAHEINNPLTSIIGFTEMLQEETDLTTIRSRLEIIEKESLRARDIVRQLLRFARKRRLHLAEVNVNALIESVMPLIEGQARSGRVRIHKEYGEVPLTVADPDQLTQVFLNIMNNAIASINNGGDLFITTTRRGEYLSIDFRDTGHGIPKDVLGRIFEPFFTTKKEKGTGLGLSISYRIIQDHGGRIDVDSAEGRGSTFTIRLPIKTAEQVVR